jgi:hypothetical protein
MPVWRRLDCSEEIPRHPRGAAQHTTQLAESRQGGNEGSGVHRRDQVRRHLPITTEDLLFGKGT